MNETLQYAGFWRRFGAYMIDSVIIAFALNQLGNLCWSFLSLSLSEYNTLRQYVAVYLFTMSIPLTWVYFSGMESSPLQATIGKLVIGLYVTDLQGHRISFGRATGRFYAKLLSGMLLLIGYLMAGFTEKKQALHDTMAKCLVLRK
jgi:uncharacterized RDD family membrane protein YckC